MDLHNSLKGAWSQVGSGFFFPSASSCTRGALGWIFGKSSSPKQWPGVGTGMWWGHHSWGDLMWHLGTWFSAGSDGFDSLSGLFQRDFCDSMISSLTSSIP